MGTNQGAAVEIWNPCVKAWWLEDIDHSMSLKGWPELLIRFMDISYCPGSEQLLGETNENSPALTTNTNKHQLEVSSNDARDIEAHHIIASSWLPPHLSWSSSIMPCPSPYQPPFLAFPPSLIFLELDLAPSPNSSKHEMPYAMMSSPSNCCLPPYFE
jgi:hypothetical protein